MVGGGEGNPLSLGDSDTRRRGQTTSRRGLWSEEEKREKWKRRFFCEGHVEKWRCKETQTSHALYVQHMSQALPMLAPDDRQPLMMFTYEVGKEQFSYQKLDGS